MAEIPFEATSVASLRWFSLQGEQITRKAKLWGDRVQNQGRKVFDISRHSRRVVASTFN